MQESENKGLASENLKPWQNGYDLEFLKSIEGIFQRYNKYSLSPFSQYKKNNVAEDLKNNVLQLNKTLGMTGKFVKVRTPITMYKDVILGYKLPGDFVIEHITFTDPQQIKETFQNEFTQKLNVWVFAWVEDRELVDALISSGFQHVGTKITTFSEMIGIFFRDALYFNRNFMGKREHPKLSPIEHFAIKKISNDFGKYHDEIQKNLSKLDISYANHYSNYNKNNAWAALSLRGYSSDINFIAKPEEMNKKWKEKNKDIEYKLQYTELWDKFPEINAFYKELLGVDDITIFTHRIRFMQLQPGGGELERHTDQVDPDVGATWGKLVRLHFPIITNENVEFTTWNHLTGKEENYNMKPGELWYLDTRKPHRAINNGNSPRIHLVTDFVLTQKLEKLIQ